MREDQLAEFVELWEDRASDHVLVRVERDSVDLRDCAIYCKSEKSAVVIDDDDLAMRVIQRMVDAGVPIVDEIPG